jgi:hypothetical protein
VDEILYLGRVQGPEVIVWGLVTLTAWWAFVRFLRRARAAGRLPVTYAMGASVIAATAALAFSIVVFPGMEAHPTVQLNGVADRSGWGLWTSAWPWWFFGLPGLGVAVLGVTSFRTRTQTPGVKLAIAVALLQIVVSWVAVAGNFPSV